MIEAGILKIPEISIHQNKKKKIFEKLQAEGSNVFEGSTVLETVFKYILYAFILESFTRANTVTWCN